MGEIQVRVKGSKTALDSVTLLFFKNFNVKSFSQPKPCDDSNDWLRFFTIEVEERA